MANLGGEGVTQPLKPFRLGSSDFTRVRKTSYYVDKSDVIRLLEAAESDHLLLMRPSRMGKTLLCNMLDAFYDYKGAEDFPALFEGLAVADYDSPNKSQMHVLYVSLSSPPGERLTVETGFRAIHDSINTACSLFAHKYGLRFAVDHDNSFKTLEGLAIAVGLSEHKRLYVVVDEYDRIANLLVRSDPESYVRYVEEDRKLGDLSSSPIRGLFTTIKNIADSATRLGLEDFRSFTAGITPLALADASVFNLGLHVTTKSTLCTAFGFLRQEVADAVAAVPEVPEHLRRPVVDLMSDYFNHLGFYSEENQTVFHPYLCVYFLHQVQTDLDFRRHVLCAVEGGSTGHAEALVALDDLLIVRNVAESEAEVQLLAKLSVENASWTLDELLGSDMTLPASLLQLPVRTADFLAPTMAYRDMAPMDAVKLYLLYNGLLSTSGVLQLKHADGHAYRAYRTRLANRTTQLMTGPLRTALQDNEDVLLPLLYRFDAPKLRTLLQGLVALPSVKDDGRARSFDEGGLQYGIRSWFQQWKADCRRPDLRMELELRARLGAQFCGAFVDVCIYDDITGHALVLELKRLRASSIAWTAYKPARGFKTKMRAWLKVDPAAAVAEVSDEDVFGLPLAPDYLIDGAVNTGGHFCVHDVVEAAQQQLQGYIKDIRRHEKLRTKLRVVFPYVALVVHNRVIVVASDAI